MKNKIAVLIASTALFAGCTQAPEVIEPESELDWSQTSTITLEQVAMASSTKATETPMAIGQTFRLYAIDPKTKNILATQTYTITDAVGKPKVDTPDNEVIALPFGVVDIFLVGPVKATINAEVHEIASPTKVTPMRGVDLISSRTRVTIKTKETLIVPYPLEHRMVKLAIEVRMVKDVAGGEQATYQDAQMTDPKHFIGIENMGGTGTFTFDDQGGSVTAAPAANYQYTYAAGNADTGEIVQTSAGEVVGDPANGYTGAVYTVVDYMTPTSNTTPKLTVTYGYTRRDVSVKTPIAAHAMSGKTKTPQEWVGGTYVKILTKLIPSIDMTLRTDILPWADGGTTPEQPIDNAELLFWYSGEDEPETIDGKLCWRDRSGNGNHAVIMGSMAYDAVNKCYYATTSSDHFVVPALGKVAEYTLEMTVQSVLNAKNSAVDFSGAAGMFIHLPYSTGTSWYAAAENKYEYGAADKYIFEQLSSYAFCRNTTTAAVVINGVQKQAWSRSESWADFNVNKLWYNSVTGGVGKQKLYGVRMYKKDMNTPEGLKTLAANHAAKLSQQGVTAPLSGTTFDYVKDGLILDLRGETAPTGTNPNRIWTDQSGRGNSPTLDAGAGQFSDAARGTKYYGGNNSGDYIRFQKSLGTYKELTYEFVVQAISESGSNCLIQFVPDISSPVGRSGIYYCDFSNVNNGFVFEAPYLNDSKRVRICPAKGADTKLKYPVTTLSQGSCYRKGNSLYVSQNGYWYQDFKVDINSEMPNQLINGTIPAQTLRIYAIRIYNRALSDMERQHNYLVDKNKYKILP